MTDRETPLRIPHWQPAYSSGPATNAPRQRAAGDLSYPYSGPTSQPVGQRGPDRADPLAEDRAGSRPAGGVDALALAIGLSFLFMLLALVLLIARA